MPGRTRLREVKLTLPMAPDMEVVASQAASSLAAFIGMSPDRVDEVRLAVAAIDQRGWSLPLAPDDVKL